MQLRVDLHVHSAASGDGCSTIEDIIAAARAKGLGGVAITDHDVQLSAQSAMDASARHSFIVIPGVEVSTDAGHLLVLLPRREFRRGMPFMEAVDQSASDGSAVVIPHPTDPISHGVGEPAVRSASPRRVALETLNASTLTRYNRSAARLAESLSLPRVGGSDAHLAKAVGDAWTDIDIGSDAPSPEAVSSAILMGRTSPSGRRTSKLVSLETVLRRAVRKGSER